MGLSDSFEVGQNWLVPTRHVAGLAELREVFVSSAPNSQQRERLFRALELWMDRVSAIVEVDRFWIDGGFLTHKQAVPDDVDVVAFVRSEHLTDEVTAQLEPLITRIVNQTRVKPISGMVDAFISAKSREAIDHWAQTWMSVRDATTGEILMGVNKGFVEVKL